jgi:hypothetical protein
MIDLSQLRFFYHFVKKKQYTTTRNLQYLQKKLSISGATLFVATALGYGWRISPCCRATLCCGSAGEANQKNKRHQHWEVQVTEKAATLYGIGTT